MTTTITATLNGRKPDWTAANEDRLREMVREDYSYNKMADEFGISRSAVSGKIQRMGLVKNPTGPRVEITLEIMMAREEADRESRRRYAKRYRDMIRSGEITRMAPRPFSPRSAELPLPPKNLSFSEIDFRFFCAYPTHTSDAPATYCGHDRELLRSGKKSSYCSGHSRLCHS